MTDYTQDPNAPRGIRNDNPCNIRHIGKQVWMGEIDPDEKGFCRFANPIHGLRAGFIIFRTYQEVDRINTVQLMIQRWAPATENNTGSYLLDVCTRTGLAATAPVNLQDKGVAWLKAIVMHENGQDPYADSLYTAAILMAQRR